MAPTILTREQWQADIQANWKRYYADAQALKLKTRLGTLVATVLLPLFPQNEIGAVEYLTAPLEGSPRFDAYRDFVKQQSEQQHKDLKVFVKHLLATAEKNSNMQEALNYLVLESGIFKAIEQDADDYRALLEGILNDAWHRLKEPSGIRVVAEQIIAGGNVIIAGRDSNLVSQDFAGDTATLLAYLASVRAEWNRPDLNRILPFQYHAEYTLHIHNLFTPLDVWCHDEHGKADEDELIKLRFKAVNEEQDEMRRSVIEMIASHPYLVVTGGAGTGKSYLARYITACLSYACDPQEAERQRVDGLMLLGNAWIHGPLLPLYIPMRNFAASEHFPATLGAATATNLLRYICATTGEFGNNLEQYLVRESDGGYRALLILDGLDEVDSDEDRIIIQKVIEQWADRFSQCRILVTSRTYAYRQNVSWRLSNRFTSAELAPFSRNQIGIYITDWYDQASRLRPASFGGKEVASEVTRNLARELKTVLKDDENSLLPLMRQPLLMAMLTLIHETRRSLPDKTSERYEATIDLLNRWMPHSTSGADRQTRIVSKINHDLLLDALKLAAFHLQCRQQSYQKYPGMLSRKELRQFLKAQNTRGRNLGVSINTLLEYLGTRNGVLLSDRPDQYRFPHLSIQEYLAASALIELYDECQMPEGLKPAEAVWTFPENLTVLLSHAPYRWRNVAMFVGAVISGNKGQDGRWTLIEELLPQEEIDEFEEDIVFRIYIAGEIWASAYLKARLPSHRVIQSRLVNNLERIRVDDRLDAPERNLTASIIQQLIQQMKLR
ncbi:MAG: NACHT domain-containing protein [Chloroflexota bacterium]